MAIASNVKNWGIMSILMTSIGTVLLIISLLISTFATFPRTKKKFDSLLYFGAIVSKDFNQYKKAIENVTTETYVDELDTAMLHKCGYCSTKIFTGETLPICILLEHFAMDKRNIRFG